MKADSHQPYLKNIEFINNCISSEQNTECDKLFDIVINKTTGIFHSRLEIDIYSVAVKLRLINKTCKIINLDLIQPIFTKEAVNTIKLTLSNFSTPSQLMDISKKKLKPEPISERLKTQYQKCFGDVLDQQYTVKKVAKHSFKRIAKQLDAVNPTSEQLITDIYSLLFETELADLSSRFITYHSHPCWVIDRLYRALSAVTEQVNFSSLKEGACS